MGRRYKDGRPCIQRSIDINRSRLSPEKELANAIIIQAANDYVDDYLRWFCTYPTMASVTLLPGQRERKMTPPRPVFQTRHEESCMEIKKNIEFFHSGWFCYLTALNPTAFHEKMLEKALEPRFTRRTLEVKQQTDKQTEKTIHKLVELVGEFQHYNEDGTFTVKTCVQYRNDSGGTISPLNTSTKYFKCYTNEPARIPPRLEKGELVAIEGECETSDRYLLNVLNFINRLQWKQEAFEAKTVKNIKDLAKVVEGVRNNG